MFSEYVVTLSKWIEMDYRIHWIITQSGQCQGKLNKFSASLSLSTINILNQHNYRKKVYFCFITN